MRSSRSSGEEISQYGLSSLEKGKKGEEKAVNYLKSKGYKILCRNYRTKYGEIDIIAKKRKNLVFIEVKCGNSRFYPPYYRVNGAKISKIMRTINAYLHENPSHDFLRFDVLSISDDGNIDHFEDAMELDLFPMGELP